MLLNTKNILVCFGKHTTVVSRGISCAFMASTSVLVLILVSQVDKSHDELVFRDLLSSTEVSRYLNLMFQHLTAVSTNNPYYGCSFQCEFQSVKGLGIQSGCYDCAGSAL